MADSKITALAALTAADPVNDMFPVVDVSDTSMAASGTTKRISVNNILSSSPTASGNFTITGDLTVDTSTLKVDSTNNRVGIGTASPNYILDVLGASPRFHIKDNGTGSSLLDIENGAGTLYVGRENSTGSSGLSGVPYAGIMYLQSAYPLIFGTNLVERYRIDATGVATWSVAGTTAMTLDSTGLGIGGSPVNPLTVFAAASAKAPALLLATAGTPTYGWDFAVDGLTTGNLFIRRLVASVKTDVLEIDRANGNIIITSSSTPTALTVNGQLTVNATSNTNLRFSYRGSDGTTRVANLTLA